MRTLTGKTILIASGPTFAPIDAVRSITNHSSGRLGSEIGYRLHQAGADIFFLAGETSETPKTLFSDNTLEAVVVQSFRTVSELKALMRYHFMNRQIDAVVMAAAVLDYLPERTEDHKHSSQQEEWIIKLRRGEKLIEQIQDWSPATVIVGFKLESAVTETELQTRVVDLMNRSGAVIVVGNRVEAIDRQQHHARLYRRPHPHRELQISEPYTTKPAIAQALTQALCLYLQSQKETQ